MEEATYHGTVTITASPCCRTSWDVWVLDSERGDVGECQCGATFLGFEYTEWVKQFELLPVEGAPSLRFDFYLVGHGYQVDMQADGHHLTTVCRDFGDDYDPKKLQQELYAALIKTIEDWAKSK